MAVQRRKQKEKERKLDNQKSNSITKQKEDSENTILGGNDKDDDYKLRATSQCTTTGNKKQRAVYLKLQPKKWSKDISLVVDKYKISYRGLAEVIYTVIRSGGESISDTSISDETIRRHRNVLRK